jgi:hypothetical protein
MDNFTQFEKVNKLKRLETEITVRSIVLSMVLDISNAFLTAYGSTHEQLNIIQAAFEKENNTIKELGALLKQNLAAENFEN